MPIPKGNLRKANKIGAKYLAGDNWKHMGRSEKKAFREWLWDNTYDFSDYEPSKKYIKHRFKDRDLVDIAEELNTAKSIQSPQIVGAWDAIAFNKIGNLLQYNNTQDIITSLTNEGIDYSAPLDKEERKVFRKWLISSNDEESTSLTRREEPLRQLLELSIFKRKEDEPVKDYSQARGQVLSDGSTVLEVNENIIKLKTASGGLRTRIINSNTPEYAKIRAELAANAVSLQTEQNTSSEVTTLSEGTQKSNTNIFWEDLLNSNNEEELQAKLNRYNNLIWNYYDLNLNLKQEDFNKLTQLNLKTYNPILYEYLSLTVHNRNYSIDTSELNELKTENEEEYAKKVEKLKEDIKNQGFGEELTSLILNNIEDPYDLSFYSDFLDSESSNSKPLGTLLFPSEIQKNLDIYNSLGIKDPFLKQQTKFSTFIPNLIKYYLNTPEEREEYRKKLSDLISENKRLNSGSRKLRKNEEKINNLLQEFDITFNGYSALNYIGLSDEERQYLKNYTGEIDDVISRLMPKSEIIAKPLETQEIPKSLRVKHIGENSYIIDNKEYEYSGIDADHTLVFKDSEGKEISINLDTNLGKEILKYIDDLPNEYQQEISFEGLPEIEPFSFPQRPLNLNILLGFDKPNKQNVIPKLVPLATEVVPPAYNLPLMEGLLNPAQVNTPIAPIDINIDDEKAYLDDYYQSWGQDYTLDLIKEMANNGGKIANEYLQYNGLDITTPTMVGSEIQKDPNTNIVLSYVGNVNASLYSPTKNDFRSFLRQLRKAAKWVKIDNNTLNLLNYLEEISKPPVTPIIENPIKSVETKPIPKPVEKKVLKPKTKLLDLTITKESKNLRADPDYKKLIKSLVSYWQSIGMSEDEIDQNIEEAFEKKVFKVNKELSSILMKLLNPINNKELISTLTPIMLKTIIPITYDVGGFGSIRAEGEASETIQKVLRGIMRNDIQGAKKYFLSVLNAILSKSSQLNTSEISYVNELKRIIND